MTKKKGTDKNRKSRIEALIEERERKPIPKPKKPLEDASVEKIDNISNRSDMDIPNK